MAVFITDQKELRRFIQQEPLIARNALASTNQLIVPTTLYFGMGLCNRHSLSQGFPIDVMAMILISERLGKEKFILIADSHAKSNGFDQHKIDLLAMGCRQTLQRIFENLGLTGWEILLASELDSSEEYLSILNTIREQNKYLQRELADIAWFRRTKETTLKVGWILNGSRDSSETFFDQKFQMLFSDPMSFLYLVPGRTFDPQRPKASPYFCEDPAARILLQSDENVKVKIAQAKELFGEQAMNTYRNFLKLLARLFDQILEPTEKGPVDQKIQEILERCLN